MVLPLGSGETPGVPATAGWEAGVFDVTVRGPRCWPPTRTNTRPKVQRHTRATRPPCASNGTALEIGHKSTPSGYSPLRLRISENVTPPPPRQTQLTSLRSRPLLVVSYGSNRRRLGHSCPPFLSHAATRWSDSARLDG